MTLIVHTNIIPARVEHAALIFDRLRENSVRELQRLDENALEQLRNTIKQSCYCWSGFADGEIACIWGIETETILTDRATLWLVTTPLVEKYSFLFLRFSKIFIESLLKQEFSLVHGMVSESFERSKLWLKWLGFTVEPAKDGFRYFYRGIK